MVRCGVVDVEEGCDDCFNVCVCLCLLWREREREKEREREAAS